MTKQTVIRGETRNHEIERVETYPRPPALEAIAYPIEITLGGQRIVATTRAYRALETFHPPTYYIPPEDVSAGVLTENPQTSVCEWKGPAIYFDVTGGQTTLRAAAWCYPNPVERFTAITNFLAFYCRPMDTCLVDGVEAAAQPGRFYGGWVTPWTVGKIKGAPGTLHW